jgi:type II secretory pathway component GspD/PulD (secretin)
MLVLLGLPSVGIAMEQVNAEPQDETAAVSAEPVPMTLSMDFKDAALKDVLKAFSQQTGINVIAGADVEDREVTIYFEEVAAMDALDQILQASNLTYERPLGSEIYIVKPAPGSDKVDVLTETRVYRLRYARVSTSRLAKASQALGARTPFEALQLTQLNMSASSGGGGGGGGGFGGGGSSTENEIGIDNIIQELLTEHGKVVVDERTNSLIVTDVPTNFARIETALGALDIRTAQILIEAEVLETTLAKAKDLGVEWSQDAEGTFLDVTPGSRTTRFPFSVFGNDKIIGTTGITLGTVSAASARTLLQALEKDTDTKILARPKVLTLDNESAVIRLTSQQAIGFESATGEISGTTTSKPERTTTGVILVVTPQVNDNGYITMLVEPSVTKVVAAQITGNVKDPKSRSTRSLVRIRNGETLVIGGLIDRSEEHSLRAVPVLSGIPIFGEAFKDRELNDSATELVVFITPRILSEPAETVAHLGLAPAAMPMREQAGRQSRQQSIEQALNRLDE